MVGTTNRIINLQLFTKENLFISAPKDPVNERPFVQRSSSSLLNNANFAFVTNTFCFLWIEY